MDTTQSARPATAKGTNALRAGSAVTTGLFAVLIAISGVLYLIGPPAIVAAIRNLGYPDYFRQLLGVAKLLGAAALIAPRIPTLREWAYAGFTFDLLAAIASHALSSEPIAHAAPAVFALALLAASWSLRRRLQSAP
jgi:MYXO-CTERM domain-containing protein